jgi:hypothetical protein
MKEGKQARGIAFLRLSLLLFILFVPMGRIHVLVDSSSGAISVIIDRKESWETVSGRFFSHRSYLLASWKGIPDSCQYTEAVQESQ